MISKIFATRVEPCFWGMQKAECGEISRVKKTQIPNKKQANSVDITDKTPSADTFTSSKDDKEKSDIVFEENNDKN